LALYATNTIVEIDFSACFGVTNQGLGYLVDNVGNQLSKISIWGLAHIGEVFLDGHTRVSEIEVFGAWMKKGN
jgi:hypothetical protein